MSLFITRWLSRDPTQAILAQDGEIALERNGLASLPIPVDRGLGQAFGWFTVPPGYWAVVTGPRGAIVPFEAGTHTLRGFPAGDCFIQFVSASPRPIEISDLSGLTSDGWTVTLSLRARVAVCNPTAILRHDDPIGDVHSLISASALHVIETLPLAAVLGLQSHPASTRGGLSAAIVKQIASQRGIDGLEVVRVDVIARSGDQRQLEILREAVVSKNELETERRLTEIKNRLSLDSLKEKQHLALVERQLALIQAKTERAVNAARERFKLDQARIEGKAGQEKWSYEKLQREMDLKFKQLEVFGQVFSTVAQLAVQELKIEAQPWGGWSIPSVPSGFSDDGDHQNRRLGDPALRDLLEQFKATLSKSGLSPDSEDSQMRDH